ncbi:hypothetical protein LCGC14_0650160 [marine sediment metagenome]|uniref:Uncharacterized protein n=1 Tax=marine sediment metagenome TaxID=412755 RepID=A0A0F9RG90_9ZZZZ|nr:hypothetical protein [Candidatus Aminicenantes bacterium]
MTDKGFDAGAGIIITLFFGFILYILGYHFGKDQARLEINALHTQIEKQNCEENTIPRLRKGLLKK